MFSFFVKGHWYFFLLNHGWEFELIVINVLDFSYITCLFVYPAVLASNMLGTFYDALSLGILYIGHKLISIIPIPVISKYYYFKIMVISLYQFT